METALLYRYGEKQLSFKLREKISAERTDIKFHGELNTTTGEWRHDVQIFSALYPVQGYKSDRTRRKMGDPYFGVLGVGGRVHYNTRTSQTSYKLGAWARSEGPPKHFYLLTRSGILDELKIDQLKDCWARVDLESMYNPQRDQFEHVVHARINKIFLSLTSRQDLKCTVGWHGIAFNNQTNITGKTYIEVQENNWSCQIDSDKRINLMYHL